MPSDEERTAEMLRKDLKRAGIQYRDRQGRVADFHALRNTFITNLARSGVSPKLAQALARRSDITLTMNTYTGVELDEQASAMEQLPSIGPGRSRSGHKHTVEPKSDAGPASALVPELVPTIDSGCPGMTSGDTVPQEQAANGKEPKSLRESDLDADCRVMTSSDKVPEVGLEPTRGLPSLDFESNDRSTQVKSSKDLEQPDLSACTPACTSTKKRSDDLSVVIEAWPHLPPTIRRAILAMITVTIDEQ